MTLLLFYIANLWSILKLIECASDKNDFQSSCQSEKSAKLKRWGRSCELLCNCKDNKQCSLTNGVCPNGCAVGWIRRSDNTTCSTRVFLLNNTRGSDFLDSANDKGGLNVFGTDAHELQVGETAVFSFVSEVTCLRRHSDGHTDISMTLTPDIPLIIKYIFVRYNLPFKLKTDEIYAEMRLNGRQLSNLFSIKWSDDGSSTFPIFMSTFKLPILITQIRIFFFVDVDSFCTSGQMSATVILYGLPQCPFRRWGLACEKICQCPCNMPECHPVTGSCYRLVHYCPQGWYGQRCEQRCSSHCANQTRNPGGDKTVSTAKVTFEVENGRKNSELFCNAASGFCQMCPTIGLTGRRCNISLDQSETAAILNACRNSENSDFFDNLKIDVSVANIRDKSSSNNTAAVAHQNAGRARTVIFVIYGSLFLFVLSFVSYAGCVRCMARRRMRKYVDDMDRQRKARESKVSWSGLKNEYKLTADGRPSVSAMNLRLMAFPRKLPSLFSWPSTRVETRTCSSESCVDPV